MRTALLFLALAVTFAAGSTTGQCTFDSTSYTSTAGEETLLTAEYAGNYDVKCSCGDGGEQLICSTTGKNIKMTCKYDAEGSYQASVTVYRSGTRLDECSAWVYVRASTSTPTPTPTQTATPTPSPSPSPTPTPTPASSPTATANNTAPPEVSPTPGPSTATAAETTTSTPTPASATQSPTPAAAETPAAQTSSTQAQQQAAYPAQTPECDGCVYEGNCLAEETLYPANECLKCAWKSWTPIGSGKITCKNDGECAGKPNSCYAGKCADTGKCTSSCSYQTYCTLCQKGGKDYCESCMHCGDGVQNCGETKKDCKADFPTEAEAGGNAAPPELTITSVEPKEFEKGVPVTVNGTIKTKAGKEPTSIECYSNQTAQECNCAFYGSGAEYSFTCVIKNPSAQGGYTFMATDSAGAGTQTVLILAQKKVSVDSTYIAALILSIIGVAYLARRVYLKATEKQRRREELLDKRKRITKDFEEMKYDYFKGELDLQTFNKMWRKKQEELVEVSARLKETGES